MIAIINRLICSAKSRLSGVFGEAPGDNARLNELAQTVGALSVKLEAREIELERTVAKLERALLDQKQFSLFFILYTLFIGIYSFVSAYLNQSLSKDELDMMSSAVCLVFLSLLILLAIVHIYFSRFSLGSFGLTLRGSRRAISESLLATIPVIVIITLVRIWCGKHLQAFQGIPFFDINAMGYMFWIYLLVAPGQEFIARGVVQGLFFRLIGGRYAGFWSIFLAALIFGVTHTYFSFWLSMVSVLGGFFWGWLYLRHQTIVGVSISHFILGNYMVLTGFWSSLQ